MSAPRIEKTERNGRTVWIKTYGDSGRRGRMATLRWVARGLQANSLLPPVPLTGEAACASELAMIRRLAAAGVRVPEVLEIGARHLVLSDLGPMLAGVLRRAPLEQRETLLGHAFNALLDLHRRGVYASQSVVRNLTWSEGQIGFIDLEEDPVAMMSLPAAQARDWLMLGYSSARFLTHAPERFVSLLQAALDQDPAEVRAELARTCRALRWLAPVARPFGRRARDLAFGLDALRLAARAD